MSDAPPNMGAILGGSGGFLTVLGMIYTAINHKRVKAKCCGKQFEIELDIGSTETSKVHPEPDVEKGEVVPKPTE